MQPSIQQLASQHGFGKSLVLVQGQRHPDYASAAVHNPLEYFADEPIYVWDSGSAVRQELLRVYVDRPVWIVHGPTLTGNGFEVLVGPISPADLQEISSFEPEVEDRSRG